MEYKESKPGIDKWDVCGMYVKISDSAQLPPHSYNSARVGRVLFESNTSNNLFVKYPISDGTYHDPADLTEITEQEYHGWQQLTDDIENRRRSLETLHLHKGQTLYRIEYRLLKSWAHGIASHYHYYDIPMTFEDAAHVIQHTYAGDVFPQLDCIQILSVTVAGDGIFLPTYR